MKILHICNKVPFPGRDGSSIAMESLIRLEALAGNEVEIVALNTDKHYVKSPKVPDELRHKVSMKSFAIDIKPGISSLISNMSRKESYFASRFFKKDIAAYVLERCSSGEIDAVVFDSLFTCVYIDGIKLPKILRAHNVEHRIWERHLEVMKSGPKKSFVRRQTTLLRKWEMDLMEVMDGVWTISEDDSSYLEGEGVITDLQNLPCTFDAESQWLYSGAASPEVYHLGAMDWAPNIAGMEWFLKEVWPLIPAQHRPKTTIVSRTQPKQFDALLDGIEWQTKRVPEEWFAQQGVLIAPLLSGSGMRIKLLEAMARGKAILTTTIGAEGLGAIHGEHLHLADEPSEFAAALQELVQNSSYRTSLGEKARELALQGFSDTSYLAQISKNLSEWAG